MLGIDFIPFWPRCLWFWFGVGAVKGGKEDKEGVGSQGMDLERDRGARNVSSQSRCHRGMPGWCQGVSACSKHHR